MRGLTCFIVAALVCAVFGAISWGCHSNANTRRGVDDGNSNPSTPADIADCRLTYYGYSESGMTALPLRYEKVELCEDDSSKCIIRLFEDNSKYKVSEQGGPIEDTLLVDRTVLDHVKELIIEAKAWEFKRHYKPRFEVMDGESWGFSAHFDVSAELLAKATPKERARMRRYGGRILDSSGSNARPNTELFDIVRDYLHNLMLDRSHLQNHLQNPSQSNNE